MSLSFDTAPNWSIEAEQAETGGVFVELVLWGCMDAAWSGIAAVCKFAVECLYAPSEPEACPPIHKSWEILDRYLVAPIV